jgi:putative oligomerization/nucleic acid binding protein
MMITPESQASSALYFGEGRSSLSPKAQVVYDRLVEGLQERAKLVAVTAWFPDLGVGVRDGNVYENTAEMKLLGPLAGAHAGAFAGRRRSADQPAAAIALVGPAEAVSHDYIGVAVVAFADGSTSEKMLTDMASVGWAQGAAAQFNSLAASVQPLDGTPSEEGPAPSQDGAGIVSQLERLAALRASGALDDEEFQAAKARIIRS